MNFSGLDPVNADLLKREIFLAKDNGATIIFFQSQHAKRSRTM